MGTPARIGDSVEDALARILFPGTTDRLLLEWLLSAGRESAFRRWIERVGDPVRAVASWPPARRNLFPLMSYTIREYGLPAPQPFVENLRAAEIHETFRCERYAGVVEDVLETVMGAAERVLYLSGLSLGPLYPRPDLRHHGECIVAAATAQEAKAVVNALCARKYELLSEPAWEFVPRVRLRHWSGLTVGVQSSFLSLPCTDGDPFGRVHAEGRVWGKHPVRVPCVGDAVLECIGRQAYDAGRYYSDWLVDVFVCLRVMTQDSIARSAAHAQSFGLSRFLRVTLDFLDRLSGTARSSIVASVSSEPPTLPERLMLRGDLFQYGRKRWLRSGNRISSRVILRHALWPNQDVTAWIDNKGWSAEMAAGVSDRPWTLEEPVDRASQ